MFSKIGTPSLIDIILTNSSNLLCNTKIVNCSISDCHCMILTTLKEQVNLIERKKVNFRSYKNFNEDIFEEDLARVPFHIAHVFDDIDDIYWANEVLFKQIVDEHAPIKQKKPRKNPPPYMNSQYRKIIYKTRQAHNAYLKNKNNKNWNTYKTLRNKKTQVMRNSIKNYFMERCSGGPKSKDFWPTIKPFLSKNSQSKNSNNVILKENNILISDQTEVCETLNNFYVNIADNIGINNNTPVNNQHPSISKISNHHTSNPTFSFKYITEKEIKVHLNSLNPKKATGIDSLPPKILKSASNIISQPIAIITNCMISNNKFPNNLRGL